MRAVSVASASFAALFLSLSASGPAAACYGNCYQGGYYQTGGGVVQGAPPLVQGVPPMYQQAPVYQAPVYQAPVVQAPIYQAPVMQAAPVYQAPVYQAPVIQTPVVVDGGAGYVNGGPGYGYSEGGYYGPRGRTVYYERGQEYQTGYREYTPYDYGVRTQYEGTYRAEPYYGGGYGGGYYGGGYYGGGYGGYYGGAYYRPYYPRRATVCMGGAYETGQAICGMRP